MLHSLTLLAGVFAVLPAHVLAVCTCPDVPLCTSANLVSSTGDEDCTVTGGVLDAGFSVAGEKPSLERVDLGGIVIVKGGVAFEATTRLVDANLSSLQSIEGGLRVTDNFALRSIALDSLVSVTGSSITATGNAALLELTLPVYTGGGETCPPDCGDILVNSNPVLASLLLPSLVAAQGAVTVGSSSANGNPSLARIGMARLTTVAKGLFIVAPILPASPLQELDLGALRNVGGAFWLFDLPSLAALNLVNLERVGGQLNLVALTSLVALELPALASIGRNGIFSVVVEASAAIESIDLSALTTAAGSLDFSATLTRLGWIRLDTFCAEANSGNIFIPTVAGGVVVTQLLGCGDSASSLPPSPQESSKLLVGARPEGAEHV
jgi:hypothetical protein